MSSIINTSPSAAVMACDCTESLCLPPASRMTCELLRMSQKWSTMRPTRYSSCAITWNDLTTCTVCGSGILSSTSTTSIRWCVASVRSECSVPFIVFSSVIPPMAPTIPCTRSGSHAASCWPLSLRMALSTTQVPAAEVSSGSLSAENTLSSMLATSSSSSSSWQMIPAISNTVPNCVVRCPCAICPRNSVIGISASGGRRSSPASPLGGEWAFCRSTWSMNSTVCTDSTARTRTRVDESVHRGISMLSTGPRCRNLSSTTSGGGITPLLFSSTYFFSSATTMVTDRSLWYTTVDRVQGSKAPSSRHRPPIVGAMYSTVDSASVRLVNSSVSRFCSSSGFTSGSMTAPLSSSAGGADASSTALISEEEEEEEEEGEEGEEEDEAAGETPGRTSGNTDALPDNFFPLMATGEGLTPVTERGGGMATNSMMVLASSASRGRGRQGRR